MTQKLATRTENTRKLAMWTGESRTEDFKDLMFESAAAGAAH